MTTAEEISRLSEVISQNPNNSDAFLQRGILYYENLRNYENSLADFDNAIRINPTSHDAYFYRGKLKIILDKYSESIEDFSRAIEINPENADAYYERGIIKWKLSKWSVNYQESLLSSFADFNQTESLKPSQDYKFYLFRGYIKVDLQEKQEAIADFIRSNELNSNFHAIWNKGLTELEIGNRESALENIRHSLIYFVVNENIDFEDSYGLDDIIDQFSKVVKEFPEIRALALLRKAEVRNERNTHNFRRYGSFQYEITISELIHSLEICIDKIKFTNELDVIKEEDFLIAQEHEWLIPEIKSFLHYIFSDCYLINSDKEEEFSWLATSRLIEICDDWSIPYVSRGYLRLEYYKDYEGAIIDNNSAIQLNPNEFVAFYNRGEAKYFLGDYEGARSDYNKAKELFQDIGEYYGNGGVIESN